MRIGFIGCGNMASALARGWGDPAICADVDAARAQALAAELGGEAVDSNAQVAERADAIVLAHKPGQLDDVAAGIDADGKIVLSLLGGVTLERIRAAYPGARCYRFMPNIAVAIRRGAIGLADDNAATRQSFAQVRELLERVGEVVVLPEAQPRHRHGHRGRRARLCRPDRRGVGRRGGSPRDAREGRRAARGRFARRRRGSCCAAARWTRSASAVRSPRRAA